MPLWDSLKSFAGSLGLEDITDAASSAVSELGDFTDASIPDPSDLIPTKGFVKKAIKGGAKSILEQKEKNPIKPATAASTGAYNRAIGSIKGAFKNPAQSSIPGAGNPYIRHLYSQYDLNKIRQTNLITRKEQIQTRLPEGSKGPTIALGGK